MILPPLVFPGMNISERREFEKDMQNVLIYMEGLHIKYIRATDREGESGTDGLLVFIKLKEESIF